MKSSGERFLRKKPNAYFDDRLITREVWNYDKKRTITVTRDKEKDWYVEKCGKDLGPAGLHLRPDARAILPHGFFKITYQGSEELAPVLAIFGDGIGKGETKASAPEAWSKKFFI